MARKNTFTRLFEDVVDSTKDFVDDLVDCVVKAVDGEGRRGPYHISSGADYSIKELYDNTIQALGLTDRAEVEVRPRAEDDAATILLDPSVTEADFGWRITTPLEEGVRRAIDYYREFGIEETYTHLRSVAPPESIEEKIGS